MKKKDSITFEKKINRLEEISDQLESEDTQLEEAIKLFEEGIELSKDCLDTLKHAELKIIELKKKIDAVTAGGKGTVKKRAGEMISNE